MQKRHLLLIVLALVGCTVFAQNEIQDKLIGKWEQVDANGKTYYLTITENNWNHERNGEMSRLHRFSDYNGTYKLKGKKRIIITVKTKSAEKEIRVKIIKLDNNNLVFKAKENGFMFNVEKTKYSFKNL